MPMSTSRSLCLYLCAFGLALAPAARAEWVVDGIPVCTASGSQVDKGIVSNGSGGAIVFWIDGRDLQRDLYAQQVAADGTIAPGWPLNGIKFGTGISDVRYLPGIPDGFGGAIIAWTDDRSFSTSRFDIFAQRITAAGTIASNWPAEGFPVCTTLADQQAPQMISDGAGGAIIAWEDCRNDPDQILRYPKPDIYALRITAEGEVAPGWLVDGIPICTEPEAQWYPALAADGAGGAVIAWSDVRNASMSGADIYAQRVTQTGQIASGWIPDGLPVCTAEGNQILPKALPARQGGAIFIWEDARTRPPCRRRV